MNKRTNNLLSNNLRAIRYLAYGSNLHPARLQARVSSAAFSAVVRLRGWSLNFSKIGRDGSGKCNIVKSEEGVIHVAIYKISIKDLQQLDVIEGIGRGYRSSMLNVPRIGACHVYLAQESFIDHQQAPYDWYKELVLAGVRHHSFPIEYVKYIEKVRSKIDLDQKRAQNNLSVLTKSI